MGNGPDRKPMQTEVVAARGEPTAMAVEVRRCSELSGDGSQPVAI